MYKLTIKTKTNKIFAEFIFNNYNETDVCEMINDYENQDFTTELTTVQYESSF